MPNILGQHEFASGIEHDTTCTEGYCRCTISFLRSMCANQLGDDDSSDELLSDVYERWSTHWLGDSQFPSMASTSSQTRLEAGGME
jgi:hypothetical protein